MLRNSEAGLLSKVYTCARELSQTNCRISKVTIFESVPEYIEQYSGFSDLILENFHSIFVYFFLVCSLIFVAFCMHHLVKCVEKRRVLIRLWLRSMFHRIQSMFNFIQSLFRSMIRADAPWRVWLRRGALILLNQKTTQTRSQ